MNKIIRHSRGNVQAVDYETKAKKLPCVAYAKKYSIGSGHYACVVSARTEFPDDVYAMLMGKARNYAIKAD